MTPRPVDPELLAALLDGRLDAEARARALASLAESPEMLEAYADAIAVRAELDATPVGAAAPASAAAQPHASRRRYRPAFLISLSAAAAIVVGALLIRGPHSTAEPALGGPLATLALLSGAGAEAPIPPNAWPASRGGDDSLGVGGRSVRVGAAITELGIQLTAGDADAAATARRIASLLDALPAASVAGQRFRDLADRRPGASLSSAVDAAGQFLRPRELRVGTWLAALRLAAARNDSAFVAASARSGLADLRMLATDAPALRPSVDSLAGALGAATPDRASVDAAAVRLLRVLGR